MNRKLQWSGIIIILIAVVVVSIYYLSQPQSSQDILQVDEEGNTSINETIIRSTIAEIPKGTLSEAEKEGILYMREEEKLAHDVYLTLYEKWNLPIFENIGGSEQTHTDAVKILINRYGLEDPYIAEKGKFSNPKIQELYNTLVEQGNKSSQEALRVGAAIEEIDILDLKDYIAQTDKEDIKLVYENLMKGSRNHLRAFVSTLEKQSIQYTPQYLSQEEYDQIINSPIEKGGFRGI